MKFNINRCALDRGIEKFQSGQGRPWGFDEEFYRDLRKMRSCRFTPKWWEKIYQTNKSGSLTKWRATRNAQNDVREEGRRRLCELRQAYESIPNAVKKSGIESKSCDWDIVEPLFGIAHKIKETKGKYAVFASKLCHFILPKAFPVIDHTALRVNNPNAEVYREYWKLSRQQWCACDKQTKDALCEQLRKEIWRNDKASDLTDYPWATKIAELCVMGRR